MISLPPDVRTPGAGDGCNWRTFDMWMRLCDAEWGEGSGSRVSRAQPHPRRYWPKDWQYSHDLHDVTFAGRPWLVFRVPCVRKILMPALPPITTSRGSRRALGNRADGSRRSLVELTTALPKAERSRRVGLSLRYCAICTAMSRPARRPVCHIGDRGMTCRTGRRRSGTLQCHFDVYAEN